MGCRTQLKVRIGRRRGTALPRPAATRQRSAVAIPSNSFDYTAGRMFRRSLIQVFSLIRRAEALRGTRLLLLLHGVYAVASMGARRKRRDGGFCAALVRSYRRSGFAVLLAPMGRTRVLKEGDAAPGCQAGTRCFLPLPIRSARPMRCKASRSSGQFSGSW